MSNQEALSLQFISHTLGLSEIRLAFELACRKHHLELKLWRDEKALKAAYDRVPVGKKLEAILPDAFIIIRLPEQKALYFFLEYDRGVENLKFIRKKMAAYVAYFRTDLCQQRFGTNHIRVLTVYEGKSTSATKSRLQHLKKTTEEEGGTHRYYFTDLASVTDHDILHDPIWHRAGAATTVPLVLEHQRGSSKGNTD